MNSTASSFAQSNANPTPFGPQVDDKRSQTGVGSFIIRIFLGHGSVRLSCR